MSENSVGEVVLPSGRFASMRAPVWEDMIIAYDTNLPLMVAKLIHRLVEIDGAPLNFEDILRMPNQEIAPMANMVGRYLETIGKLSGGVK